ncbi:MAG: GNAT family N-acetyltransferase [Planctomycetota bacterium]
MQIMELKLARCVVRTWRESDAASITRHANNRRVWRNLRDAFPHPYGIDDARRFIAAALEQEPQTRFAVDVGGEAVGSIAFTLHADVERVAAEIGYFLGEAFWGRGIMTEAVRAVRDHAIAAHRLTRVYALPFEWSHASCRVLEKAGFVLEGRLRRSAIKDGKVIDQLMYASIVEGDVA